MPTFTLDDSAHKILKQVRDKLKAAGQGADLSDAVRYLGEIDKIMELSKKDKYKDDEWAQK